MRKVALGVVAALLLAAFPLGLTSASADSVASVRWINANLGGGKAIDIYLNGALVVKDLPVGGSFGNWIDTKQDPTGILTLQVCVANGGLPLKTSPAGTCPDNGSTLGLPNTPSTGTGVQITLTGGNNYTVLLGGGAVTNVGITNLYVGLNDTSPTAFGQTRVTLNVAGIGTSMSACVDNLKLAIQVLPGNQATFEVHSEQLANVQIYNDTVGGSTCIGPAAAVNLVAGTNFVVNVLSNTNPTCTSDCAQVLFVDQDRHPNVASQSGFCAVIPSLATVQKLFKETLGPVDPNDYLTFPSQGEVKELTDTITGALDAGDFNVTFDVKPQWEIISAGLRVLAQSFLLVNYDLKGFPVDTSTLKNVNLEQLVEAANGFSLPGTVNADLQGAIAGLTAWYKANCLPTPSAAPPAATPAAAGPKFTG